MTHALAHAATAIGIYKAGEAVTHRRRAGWLALAVGGAVCCHAHHHRRS